MKNSIQIIMDAKRRLCDSKKEISRDSLKIGFLGKNTASVKTLFLPDTVCAPQACLQTTSVSAV